MCRISKLHENEQPACISTLEMYAEDHFEIHISTQEVWSIVKQSSKPPHLGNIYTELLFSKLKNALEQKHPGLPVRYEVNGVCSKFYINDEQITTHIDFITEIDEFIANSSSQSSS